MSSQGAAKVFASSTGTLLVERAPAGSRDLAQMAWSGRDDEACRIPVRDRGTAARARRRTRRQAAPRSAASGNAMAEGLGQRLPGRHRLLARHRGLARPAGAGLRPGQCHHRRMAVLCTCRQPRGDRACSGQSGRRRCCPGRQQRPPGQNERRLPKPVDLHQGEAGLCRGWPVLWRDAGCGAARPASAIQISGRNRRRPTGSGTGAPHLPRACPAGQSRVADHPHGIGPPTRRSAFSTRRSRNGASFQVVLVTNLWSWSWLP